MQLAQNTGLHELVGPSVRIGFVRLERSRLVHGSRPLLGSRTRHTPLTGDDGRLWQLGMIVTGPLRLLYLICECRTCGLKSADQRRRPSWNPTRVGQTI